MSAAGSKVNHSVVFSAVLCCRSLPLLLVFLPSPPPLASSGLWRAVVNRNVQLIAKADISWVGGVESYKSLMRDSCSLTQGLAVRALDAS